MKSILYVPFCLVFLCCPPSVAQSKLQNNFNVILDGINFEKTPAMSLQRIDATFRRFIAYPTDIEGTNLKVLSNLRKSYCAKDRKACFNLNHVIDGTLIKPAGSLESAEVAEIMWSSVFDEIKTPSEADRVLSQLKAKTTPASDSLFPAGLGLWQLAEQKDWSNFSQNVYSWILSTWGGMPKRVSPAVNDVRRTREKLLSAKPKRFDSIDKLGQLVKSWAKPSAIKLLTVSESRDFFPLLRDILMPGEVETFAKIFDKYAAAPVKTNLELALEVTGPLCFYWRSSSQFAKCKDWLDEVEKLANEAKLSPPLLAWERARFLAESGNFQKGYNELSRLATSTGPESLPTGMVPWAYLDLAMLSSLLDKHDRAHEYLARHAQLLGKENSDPWNRMPSMLIKVMIFINEGSYDKAKAKNDELAAILEKNVRGVTSATLDIAFHRVLVAAADKNVVEAQRHAVEIRSMIPKLPALKYVGVFADAVVNVAKGTYKSSDLDAARKILGPTAGKIKDIEAKIARLSAIKNK